MFRALILAPLLLGAAVASAAEPIRVIEDSLVVPAGLDAADALASVQDIAEIFVRYEPVVPAVPGVRLDLEKQVVSVEGPTVVELPVQGAAFGRPIEERARVTAHSGPTACPVEEGVRIVLDFDASSYNIERRIDRIEIDACPTVGPDGAIEIHAIGRMYAGHLPEDPALNRLNEAIGARALQGAFIKQVPAVFTAVEAHWADLGVEGS